MGSWVHGFMSPEAGAALFTLTLQHPSGVPHRPTHHYCCEGGIGSPDSTESSSHRTTMLLEFGRIWTRRSTFSRAGVSAAQTPS
jgi:hypothetical protein